MTRERCYRLQPDSRRPPLLPEFVPLGNAVARKFPDEDRKRAGVADYQGVGGSDS